MSLELDPNFDPYGPEKPRPFLRPALDAAVAKIREDMGMMAVDLATTRNDPEFLGQAAWVFEHWTHGPSFAFTPNATSVAIHQIRLPPAWRLAPDPTHGVVLLSVTGQRLTAAEAVGRFGVGQDRA
jgi:hypothetical protein